MRKYFIISILLVVIMIPCFGQKLTGVNVTGIRIGFRPTDFPGCSLWLETDPSFASVTLDQTTTTNRVTQWSDLSGNLNHVSQSTLANKPAFGLTTQNGYPTIRFDGAQRLLAGATSITNLTNGDDVKYACFAVVNIDNSSNEVSFGWGNSTNSTSLILNRPIITATYRNSRTDDGGTTVNASSGSNSSTNTIWQVQGYDFNGNACRIQCNSFSATPGHNVGPITLNTFAVGTYSRNAGFANNLNGNITAIIVYNRFLTISEFNEVFAYLNNKYKVF